MSEPVPVRDEAALTLERLRPRLRRAFGEDAAGHAWHVFEARLEQEWERLFARLLHLYGDRYDFFYHLEELLATAARAWLARPAALKALDARRAEAPTWYLSQEMMGGVLYVDLFAGTLRGMHERIPYFKELGLTYLHLMPIFARPRDESDGGYAVSDYRAVDPRLGTMEELKDLAAALHEAGICLVLDFVFNHTSDEHPWARKARAGDPKYRAFYYLFPDRTLPDRYEETLREIFPAVRRGSFTWREDLERWVWTTFHSYQWDLNYRNPEVFRAMLEEMLFLANAGADVLRLDAVAFLWKEPGTSCENLPEAHAIIQAFNALVRIAAPALLFKSEAIVHPDDVRDYISPGECQLSYHPLLMALLWEAAATREVKLLVQSLRPRHQLPEGCAWVNYLRSHDDIGWTFDDADAHALGMNAYDHRQFLNAFYTGRFPGSFAAGVAFQENPDTGDARVAGTLASLAGLEQALEHDDPLLLDMAVRRIVMLHSVLLSIGGIPLVYLGDEAGTQNDYAYAADPHRGDDARWMHRPRTDWERLERRHDAATVEGRIFQELQRLVRLRKQHAVLGGGRAEILETGNPHVFGYLRPHTERPLLCLVNFSEDEQRLGPARIQRFCASGSGRLVDLVSGAAVEPGAVLTLAPYQFVWLRRQASSDT